jgi:hypothetical protein
MRRDDPHRTAAAVTLAERELADRLTTIGYSGDADTFAHEYVSRYLLRQGWRVYGPEPIHDGPWRPATRGTDGLPVKARDCWRALGIDPDTRHDHKDQP